MSNDTSSDRSAQLRLGELGVLRRGHGGTRDDELTDGVPCVRYGDLYTAHDCVIRDFASFIDPACCGRYVRLRYGDIVFAASGETHEEIGKAAVYCGHDDAYAGADTIIFRPESDVHPIFIGYAVNTDDAAQFKARFGQGSSVIHISAQHLKELPIFVPAFPEQHHIAEILDILDEAIRKADGVIAKLQQVKQGLLHDLLTRGIDENGELRDPERHPEQFEDSRLGRKPKRWEVTPLSKFLVGQPLNGIYKTSNEIGSGNLMVGQTCFTEDRSLDLRLARRARCTSSELTRFGIQTGDILVTRVFATVDGVGRPVLVPALDEPAVFESNMMRLRIAQPTVPRLLFYWLESHRARVWIRAMAKASNQTSVSQGAVADLPCPEIPSEEQQRIAEIAEAQERRIRREKETKYKLRTARHGLMRDLLTGRVRVRVHEEARA